MKEDLKGFLCLCDIIYPADCRAVKIAPALPELLHAGADCDFKEMRNTKKHIFGGAAATGFVLAGQKPRLPFLRCPRKDRNKNNGSKRGIVSPWQGK